MSTRKQIAENQKILYDDAVANNMFQAAVPSFEEFQKRLERSDYQKIVYDNYRKHDVKGTGFNSLAEFRGKFGGSFYSNEAKREFNNNAQYISDAAKQSVNNFGKYNKLKQRKQKQKNDFGRVTIGSNKTPFGGNADDVVKDDFAIDPATGKTGAYITSDNYETSNLAEAQQRQAALDRYNETYQKAVDTGEIPSVFDVRDKNGNYDLQENIGKDGTYLTEEGQHKQWQAKLDYAYQRRDDIDRQLEELKKQEGDALLSYSASLGGGSNASEAHRTLDAAKRKVDEEIRNLEALEGIEGDSHIYMKILGTVGGAIADYTPIGNVIDGIKWSINNVFGENTTRDISKAIKNSVGTAETWDFGLSSFDTAARLERIKQKVDKKIPLTKEEQLFAQNTLAADKSAADVDANMGRAYRWTSVGGVSLPYMLDFGLTGGYSGMTRAAGTFAIKQAAKAGLGSIGKTVTKYVGVAIGDVASAYAMAVTEQGLKTGADVMKRHSGTLYQDENGNYRFGTFDNDGNLLHEGGESMGKAMYKGVTAAMLENYTEKMFGHLHLKRSVFNMMRKSPALKKYAEFFKHVGKSGWYGSILNFTKKFGQGSYFEEVAEEIVNIPMNAGFVGDNSISELEDWKTWEDILGSMAISIGSTVAMTSAVKYGPSGVVNQLRKGYNNIGFYRFKSKLNQADQLASEALGDDWVGIKERIDSAPNENLGNISADLHKQVAAGKYSEEQMNAAWAYIQNLRVMRGYNLAKTMEMQAKAMTGEANTPADIRQQQLDATYAAGRETQGENKHIAQIEYEKQKFNLAKALGVSDSELEAMTDEQISSNLGMDDNLDNTIINYQNAKALYDGVMDNAQSVVDTAGQVAAQKVDAMTNREDGTIREVKVKGTMGKKDYSVYVISGNVETHDDGVINYSDSDKMIVVYNEATGRKETIPVSMLSEVNPNVQDAEDAKAAAVEQAKQKVIYEQSADIDGTLGQGSKFAMTDEQGTTHNYSIESVDESGNCVVYVDGTILPQPMPLATIQKQYNQYNVNRVEQSDQAAEQNHQQSQQPSQPIGDNLDYNQVTNKGGKVEMVDVLDKNGNSTINEGDKAFLIEDQGYRAKVMVLDSEGNLTPLSVKKSSVKSMGTMTVDEYKQIRQSELEAQQQSVDAQTTKIEDNGGIASDPTVDTSENQNEESEIQEEGEEKKDAPKFEDGTPMPVDEEGVPDPNQMTATQAAEFYDKAFEEDAEQIIGDFVNSSKKGLEKAKSMKITGSTNKEMLASRDAKKKAIADAQAKYDSAQAIADAYKERMLAKQESTAEGRRSILDKAKAKYNRLKGKAEQVQALWNETVGAVLHRLYDHTGVDVFDSTPQTIEEYVSSSIAPFSLNYEGNDNSKGVKQETGLERKDFAKSHVLAAEGKGIAVDEFVHKLWENRPAQFESATDQDIRNALIDLITSDMNAYDMRHVIENNRIAQAEKAIEDEQNAAESAAYEEETRAAAEEETHAETETTEAEEGAPAETDDALPFAPSDESDVPFSKIDNNIIESQQERADNVERNHVDDVEVVDAIIGKKVRKALERIAKMMGAKIQWQYSDRTGNGWYDEATNTIYLTLDSSITEGAQFIFGHEMTHEIKSKNPAAYEELKTLVKDMLGEDTFETMTDVTEQKYRDAGIIYTGGREAYEEEVVADQIGTWLNDANYAHTLALKMSHPLLAAIHDIIVRIKMAFNGTEYTDNAKRILRTIEQAYVATANRESVNTATQEGEGGQRMSLRSKPVPKKTQKVYKLMRLGEDGKLYPLFIGSAEAVELGYWYDADSPALKDLKSLSSKDYVGKRTVTVDGEDVQEEYNYGSYIVNNETGEAMSLADFKKQHKGDKRFSRIKNNPNVAALNWATDNGYRWIKIEEKKRGQSRYGGENRSYYNYGINGTGAVGIFAMRPGWHAGSLPTMRQIGKGQGKNLRDDTFVWVEGEIPADYDYNEEAQKNADKDIPDHIPTDGFYLKATNANKEASQADKVGWYVAGAFRPNRIMSDKETREVIDQWNKEHPNDEPVEYDWKRESGKDFNAETMSLEDTPKFSLKVDNQGNPLNLDGTLKVEKIMSINDLTDADFLHSSRNVQLPELPKKVADAIGVNDKPVIIKKNIFERNYMRHKDVTPEQSKAIFNAALYNPDLYGQNQKAKRPYNWVLINTKDEEGKNRTVLLEVNPNKDNVEIVHWHFVDERGLKKIKKQVAHEDGQLLILPSNQEEVGALSDPMSNLSAAKVGNSSESSKENGEKFSLKGKPVRFEAGKSLSEDEKKANTTIEDAISNGNADITDSTGEVVAQTDADHKAKFSLRTWLPWTDNLGRTHKGTRQQVLDYMEKQGFSKEEITDMQDTMGYWYNYMSQIANFTNPDGTFKFRAFHQWNEKQPQYKKVGKNIENVVSTKIKNGEYAVNQELSTDCIKREAFTKLVNTLIARGADLSMMGPAQINTIKNMMRKYGIQVACDLCFVEGKRLQIVNWAQTIVDDWNRALGAIGLNLDELDDFNFGGYAYDEDGNLIDDAIFVPTEEYADSSQYRAINEAYDILTGHGKDHYDAMKKRNTANWKAWLKENKVAEKWEAKHNGMKWSEDYLTKNQKKVKTSFLNFGVNDPKKIYQNTQEYANRYTEMEKEYLAEHPDGVFEPNKKQQAELDKLRNKQIKTIFAKMQRLIAEHPEMRKKMKLSDLLGSKGLMQIRQENGDAYAQLWSLILGRFGSGTPKPIQDAVPYSGEIFEITDGLISQAYVEGGARMFSFSDFDITKVFDIMQIYWDMAARKMKLQSYSKEAAYVIMFGKSGAKINMSTLPKAVVSDEIQQEYDNAKNDDQRKAARKKGQEYAGLIVDKDGNITDMSWSEEHSLKPSFCQQIFRDPERNGNCGAVTVGASVNHCVYAAAQPWIRMVIPFHLSGMPIEARRRTDVNWYFDNTEYQNTRVNIKGKQQSINSPKLKGYTDYNFYANEESEDWDMRTECRNYLKWCDEKGYTPRFEWGIDSDHYRQWCEKNGYQPNQQIVDIMDNDMTDGVWNGYYKFITDFNAYKPVLDELGNPTFDENGHLIETTARHTPVTTNITLSEAERKAVFGDLKSATPSVLQNRENSITHADANMNKMAAEVMDYLNVVRDNREGKVSDAEIEKAEAEMKGENNTFFAVNDAELLMDAENSDNGTKFSLKKEKENIIDEAKKNGTYLKAPNGEDTNLDSDQWVTVRTSNFKNWFGDWENDPEHASKVVDENGEPKVVYHYTDEKFTEFKDVNVGENTFGNASDAYYAATTAIGTWFTDNNKQPAYMGEPMQVFLNARKPFDSESLENLAASLSWYITEEDKQSYEEDWKNYQAIVEAGKEFQRKKIKDGYDSVVIDDEEFGGTSYVSFSPNQIKSADNNNGEFSTENNDIRYSLRADRFRHDLNEWKKANNLPKDAQRPSVPVREPNESAADFMNRVKEYRKEMAMWKTAPTYEGHLLTDDTAQGEFNRELQRGAVQARIALQDSMLAIRKAQEAIMKEVGVDRLSMAEDAYTAENRSHGKGKNEFEEYNDEFLQPLRKAYNALMKKLGKSYDNVKVYMIAKHGLERNAHIAFAKALEKDYDKQSDRIDAYNAYKGDVDRLLNDTDYQNGQIDFTTWRQRDNAIRLKYAPSYMDYRYDKMGITQDYSGLSALFDGSDFEEAAADLVKDVETNHPDEAAGLWYATNDATKKVLRDSYKAGMMAKDVYEYVRDMYRNYIPLRGWGDTNADQVWNYVGGGKGAFSQTLKEAHGRESLADDPIAYIENMAESGILLNNKNWVKQHLLLLAENHPTSLLNVSKAWYVKTTDAQGNEQWIPASPQITANMTAQQVELALEAFEQKMEQMKQSGDATQKREHLEISYPQTNGEEREHEVRVMRNGEEYVIYINGDPQLAQAMNNTRAQRVREGLQNSISQKVIAWVGRKMAAAYTSLSPLFIPSNYARDLTMTLASSAIREDARYNYLLRKNMLTHWNTLPLVLSYQNGTLREKVRNGSATKTEKMFYGYMMNGGETGFVSSLDVEDLKKKFKNELKDMNRMALNPKKVGHVIMDGIETLNRAIEGSNRFMVYMTSIQYGRSIEEAVNNAKDVTLNFNRKGTGEHGWQTIRNLYLFINPAIQSLQTLGALAKHHPFKFTAVTTAWLASGVLVPIINGLMMSMLGGDDDKDKYWSFTKWDRRNNMIIWVPYTHEFIKIPLAQEFRGFYGVGDMIASKLMGGEKAEQSWGEYAEDFVGQVVDMLPLDPTGYDGNIAVSLMPNPIRPFFELAFNVDFTGKPLFKDSEYNKYDPNFTKAYAGTPDWLVRISKMVNSIGNNYPDVQQNAIDKFGDPRYNLNNPAVVDHILSSYLGGAYTMGSQVLGVATKLLNGDEVKMADVPILSKFVSNPDDRPVSKKQGDEFWTTKERHDRAANTLSKLKKKAKVDGDYTTLEMFFSSDEYKQYKEDDKVVKKYEADKKKEKAEESGEEYKPHKTTYNDVYKAHTTPRDDFEELKLNQLYQKVKGFSDHWNELLDEGSSLSQGYYEQNADAIQAAEDTKTIIEQMNDIKKGFLNDGKDAYTAEDMKDLRDLRKQALSTLEKAKKGK